MHPNNEIVRIGTSGIVLSGNKSTFPAEYQTGSRLHYYSSLFNTLEINTSFYKIPLPKTFQKWTTEVESDFKFTVKLWKGITHAKRLEFNPADIDMFMHAANQLNNNRGCLLIQLPASITYKFTEQVEAILHQLVQLDDKKQWKLAIEFRHISWYHYHTYEMLDKYRASIVIHDMPGSQTPFDYTPKHLAYFRFHGPTGNYDGSYNHKFIQQYADRIKSLKQQGKRQEIYIYFNNTIGSALENAQSLQQLV